MNAIAGISGGRSSALMAKRLPPDVVLCFQNTGKEHHKTLEFIRRVEDDLQRPIVRLEFRAPPRGDPPGQATFEIVPHERLARKGEPFMDMLLCAKSYRAKHKDEGPIAPWARSRICTSYLKIRTQRKYAVSLGWSDWRHYVGLRADEPNRIANMKERNDTRNSDECAPLHEAGITKPDVLRFWAAQPYDLDLPEHLGNCTGCFLKDERDLADALSDPETDAAWWIGIEEDFAPMRRGRSSYRQVLAEAPARQMIRAALSEGLEPFSSLTPKRHATLVKQEREAAREGFSCHCEQAERLEIEDLETP